MFTCCVCVCVFFFVGVVVSVIDLLPILGGVLSINRIHSASTFDIQRAVHRDIKAKGMHYFPNLFHKVIY